jgi:hypothetical protein
MICEECHGNEVIYEFYVNHKKKEVADDWVYCPKCYPDSDGYFTSPWTKDYEILTLDEYNDYIKKGYRELIR